MKRQVAAAKKQTTNLKKKMKKQRRLTKPARKKRRSLLNMNLKFSGLTERRMKPLQKQRSLNQS
jgi:hypothetical protein